MHVVEMEERYVYTPCKNPLQPDQKKHPPWRPTISAKGHEFGQDRLRALVSSCFHYDAKATPETSSRPADNASHCVSRAMGIPALGLLHRVARSIRVVNSLGQ